MYSAGRISFIVMQNLQMNRKRYTNVYKLDKVEIMSKMYFILFKWLSNLTRKKEIELEFEMYK